MVFPAPPGQFESNFPVDKVSSSYHTLWNSFKRAAVALGVQVILIPRALYTTNH